jgi:hypothetical protein
MEVKMLNLINVILGGALLVTGRKLFWLFVGALGFITGMQLTARFWHGPEGLAIILGLVVGLVFAGLAVFLQTIAIAIAGFLAGGYILSMLVSMLGLQTTTLTWIVYIVGGILGVILVSYLFDWAVITLSSMAGASLVVQALLSGRAASGLVFTILFIAGIVIQGSMLRAEKKPEATD